ncbi:hypothetical protein AB4156_16235 [Cupriavidus sp. 2MCAB6]|uniref:hypothetical protein n=1 Tax=Cupriavidus sp. 2MCAB6 TaxID=3232981 RepID=UPI003F8E23F9
MKNSTEAKAVSQASTHPLTFLHVAPRMGVTPDMAAKNLGETCPGLFDLDGDVCHG